MAALFSIGQLSERVGVSVSAIRFYEARGLLQASRNDGGHRRFSGSDVRRLSFILITQRLGFSIDEIGKYLSQLPSRRTPTKQDWTKLSRHIRRALDERIDTLTSLRSKLDGCIGCGCLSLKSCQIYNPADQAAKGGAGPRYLLGDDPALD